MVTLHFYFLLHKLSFAAMLLKGMQSEKGGKACVTNEDLDTGAAHNRPLLSTGQDLSYTY